VKLRIETEIGIDLATGSIPFRTRATGQIAMAND
jgi:hypothetical protein